MDSCITMNVYLHDLYWTYMQISQHLAHEIHQQSLSPNFVLSNSQPKFACVWTAYIYWASLLNCICKGSSQCAENTIYQIHRGDNRWCHISETCPSATQQRCRLALQHNSRKIRGEEINLQNWDVGKFNQKRRVLLLLNTLRTGDADLRF